MLDTEKRDLLASLPTPFLVDAMYAEGMGQRHLDVGIRPVWPFSKMVGAATTVKLKQIHDEAKCDLMGMEDVYGSPSEACSRVIVIEVPPQLHRYGIVGDGAATMGRRNGFVGALVEGAVRDTHGLKEMDFPAFSRTVSPGLILGKAAFDSVGQPVQVGGQTIYDGDVIVGDNDGVVVIRDSELDRLITRAASIGAWEQRMNELMAAGKSLKEAEQIAGKKP